jgi:copper chaperone CopZ
MRNWMLVAVMFAFALSGQAIAQTKDGRAAICKLKVSGMTCSGCEAAVKMAAKRVDGVKSVTASAKSGTAEVSYDASKTSPEAIAKAVTANSGFKAEVARK